MPTITDVFSTLHDSLTGLLKPTGGSVMQMSWPGFALSATDFKRQANPNNPYDAQVAEETVSRIADMIPAADDLRFEDSGFEVHNVYEALIFGATPKGDVTDPRTNPAYKLFLDAQFEFILAAKGSLEDPLSNYYPCKATPLDWYNEANTNWQPFSITQTQVKTATPRSRFVALGGRQLVDQGVFRVRPAAVTVAQLSSELQTSIRANAISAMAMTKAPSRTTGPAAGLVRQPRALAIAAAAVKPEDSIRARVVTQSGGSVADEARLRNALIQLNAQPGFKKSVQVTPVAAKIRMTDPQLIDRNRVAITRTAPINLNERIVIDRMLAAQLPKSNVQATSENWNLSFRYCLVNLNRRWLNSTILNLPGWYFPGAPAGFFSAGVPGKNAPQFPMLPHAFLAIRDLRISAKWSDQDLKNVTQSVTFGPFDLRSKVIDRNEIRVDGLQVIAWLSTHTPALAPLGDPSPAQ
jgi:hypothetical protein